MDHQDIFLNENIGKFPTVSTSTNCALEDTQDTACSNKKIRNTNKLEF